MEPTEIAHELARSFLADCTDILGPTLHGKILGYVRSRSIADLAGVSGLFDPEYHDRNVLKTLLQLEAFYKKNAHFSNENCSEVALNAFLESEEVCKATNDRLDQHNSYTQGPSAWVYDKCESMREIIARTLGPIDAFHERLPSLVRATNGATVAHPRRLSGGAARLRRTMYATEGSHAYLKALAAFWGYTINFRKIHHNRVELVPKNWKTHRTIACEPEGNIALQLAFDTYCKRKLRSRLNIDLSDQSRNQRLAEEASVHGNLCTVDLTAASDRLALNVVHLLFPREWVDFFLATRSPCWKDAEGKLIPYHKLSSMGNGYTFTVETLVFSAVCKSLGSKEYSVYGDDIIVETELYEELCELLSYLGFEVNQEKSHANQIAKSEDLGILSSGGSHPVLGAFGHLEKLLRETESIDSTVPVGNPSGAATDLSGRIRRDLVGWLSNVIEGCIHRDERAGSNIGTDVTNNSGSLAGRRGITGSSGNTISGVYRESCGVHFYGGHLVTPLFLRALRSKRDWVLLVNNITSFAPPGGTCWKLAAEIVRQQNLPIGPPVLDTGACVFIDVHTCYRRGLIRTPAKGRRHFGPWQPVFRALVERNRSVSCFDSRALFLWFLHRKSQPYESSRHSLGTYKCRLKWVRYRPAMADIAGGTVRLHWWTELLLAGDGR